MGRGGRRAQTESTKTVTAAEVAKHNTIDDGWIVYDGKVRGATWRTIATGPARHAPPSMAPCAQVYDVSGFVKHPGGKVVFTYAGKDASDVFRAFHSPETAEQLSQRYVADLAPSEAPHEPMSEEGKRNAAFAEEFRQLRTQLQEAGLFRARCAHGLWGWEGSPVEWAQWGACGGSGVWGDGGDAGGRRMIVSRCDFEMARAVRCTTCTSS